jgi:hypothetical protein
MVDVDGSDAASSTSLATTEPFSPTEHLERLMQENFGRGNTALAYWYEYLLHKLREEREQAVSAEALGSGKGETTS